jgi:hypothetical protein
VVEIRALQEQFLCDSRGLRVERDLEGLGRVMLGRLSGVAVTLDMPLPSLYDAVVNIWYHDARLNRTVEEELYRAKRGNREQPGYVRMYCLRIES